MLVLPELRDAESTAKQMIEKNHILYELSIKEIEKKCTLQK
jgi:hypothetical protein